MQESDRLFEGTRPGKFFHQARLGSTSFEFPSVDVPQTLAKAFKLLIGQQGFIGLAIVPSRCPE